MNTKTNELFRTDNLPPDLRDKLINDGLIIVPDELNRAANQVLKGNEKANVSFNSGGKLSKWAERVRKNQKLGRLKNKII